MVARLRRAVKVRTEDGWSEDFDSPPCVPGRQSVVLVALGRLDLYCNINHHATCLDLRACEDSESVEFGYGTDPSISRSPVVMPMSAQNGTSRVCP